VPVTMKELIGKGFLAPYRIFAPSSPDLTGVKTRAGDFVVDDLDKAMNKTRLVADIVETWQQRGENRNTLCFCVSRAHARAVALQFERATVDEAIEARRQRKARHHLFQPTERVS
jgi:superfamily II DNA or RNA helicase